MPLERFLARFSPTARQYLEGSPAVSEEQQQKATELGKMLGGRYNVSPFLGGSMATGMALPGSQPDYDYGVRVTSQDKFNRLVNRLERSKDFQGSQFDKPNTDYRVFQGQIGDTPVDLSIMYGDKGRVQREAIQGARQTLAEDQELKDKLMLRKAIAKDVSEAAPGFLKSPAKKLYKKVKRSADVQLGLPRFQREALPEKTAGFLEEFAQGADSAGPVVPEALQLSREIPLGSVRSARNRALSQLLHDTGFIRDRLRESGEEKNSASMKALDEAERHIQLANQAEEDYHNRLKANRAGTLRGAVVGAGVGLGAGGLGAALAPRHVKAMLLGGPAFGAILGSGMGGLYTTGRHGSPQEATRRMAQHINDAEYAMKTAAVPGPKKMYRRALQLLQEGTHGFHGAGDIRKTTAIAESGKLLPSTEGALGEGVYWAAQRPDINYFGAGGGVASPLEGIRAKKLVEKARPGHQGLRGSSFITTEGPHQLSRGDYFIEGFSRNPEAQAAHDAAVGALQRTARVRRISGDALQDAFTDLARTKTAAELTEEQLARLGRADVFGHRTHNIEPIMQSGKLMSAAQAGKAGLLKSVELGGAHRGERQEIEVGTGQPTKLRSEVFMTKGILPASEDYGRYGVMFEKHKATPSSYLNTIPQEHLHEGRWRSNLHFVVPDSEYDTWQSKYPGVRIMRESQIPQGKLLPEKAGVGEMAMRVLRGPSLFQKKEEVVL